MKRTPLRRKLRPSVPKRKATLHRGKALKKVNAKRRASEFARTYHSRERVAFVKTLPCPACVGYVAWVLSPGRIEHNQPSENAHYRGDGAGRKAHYTTIFPACHAHHRELHQHGQRYFEEKYSFDLEDAAAITEQSWQAFQGTTETTIQPRES